MFPIYIHNKHSQTTAQKRQYHNIYLPLRRHTSKLKHFLHYVPRLFKVGGEIINSDALCCPKASTYDRSQHYQWRQSTQMSLSALVSPALSQKKPIHLAVHVQLSFRCRTWSSKGHRCFVGYLTGIPHSVYFPSWLKLLVVGRLCLHSVLLWPTLGRQSGSCGLLTGLSLSAVPSPCSQCGNRWELSTSLKSWTCDFWCSRSVCTTVHQPSSSQNHLQFQFQIGFLFYIFKIQN